MDQKFKALLLEGTAGSSSSKVEDKRKAELHDSTVKQEANK